MEYTPQHAIELVDAHHAAKLRELAEEYNEQHPDSAIASQYLDDSIDIIFSLWAREQMAGVIGFGHPYDEIIRGWVPSEEDGDKYRLDLCGVYVGYRHPELLKHYLVFGGLARHLPVRGLARPVRNRVGYFNNLWTSTGRQPILHQEDLLDLLHDKSMTALDWVVMLCSAMAWGLVDETKLLYAVNGHY